MRYWYYYESEQQKGPIADEEFTILFGTGSLPANTLVWSEGLTEWVEARMIENLVPAAFIPPPAPASQPEPKSSQVIEKAPELLKHIKPYPTLILFAISTCLGIVPFAIRADGHAEAADSACLRLLPLDIAAVVFIAILHYRCWKAVPPQCRATTPGKAVGFLFIPVFDFFWAFISWPKLAEGLIKSYPYIGQVTAKKLKKAAFWCAVFFTASFFVGLLPDDTPAQFVFMFMAYHTIVTWRFYSTFASLANTMTPISVPAVGSPPMASRAGEIVCLILSATIVVALLAAWIWVEDFELIWGSDSNKIGRIFLICTFFFLLWPPLVSATWSICKRNRAPLPSLGRKEWLALAPLLGIPFMFTLTFYLIAPSMAPYRGGFSFSGTAQVSKNNPIPEKASSMSPDDTMKIQLEADLNMKLSREQYLGFSLGYHACYLAGAQARQELNRPMSQSEYEAMGRAVLEQKPEFNRTANSNC
jgi:hypothetical protein